MFIPARGCGGGKALWGCPRCTREQRHRRTNMGSCQQRTRHGVPLPRGRTQVRSTKSMISIALATLALLLMVASDGTFTSSGRISFVQKETRWGYSCAGLAHRPPSLLLTQSLRPVQSSLSRPQALQTKQTETLKTPCTITRNTFWQARALDCPTPSRHS